MEGRGSAWRTPGSKDSSGEGGEGGGVTERSNTSQNSKRSAEQCTKKIECDMNNKPIFNVLYGNARSVINKLDELRATVFDLKPDFVFLTETLSNQQHLTSFLSIQGYQ